VDKSDIKEFLDHYKNWKLFKKCVVVRSLYRAFLYAVLLPVLGILILCGLLSHQIVGKVCICYLSVCSIFLLHST
jgi:hypothetical protein